MTDSNTLYDLMLLLDPTAEDERKTKILADVEHLIGQHGEVVSVHDWGLRPTTFEIRKRAEAEYHLVQFHGSVELLQSLDHALKITDGVLRHRVIKLKPGTPPPPVIEPPGAEQPLGEELEEPLPIER